MSTFVTGLCKASQLVVGASRVGVSVHRASRADGQEEFWLHTCNATAEAVAFLLNTTALIGDSTARFSNQTLSNLKGAEFAANIVKIGPTIARVICDWVEGRMDIIQAIEQGLIAPTAGLIRVATECSIYKYRHLATLPDDKRFVWEAEGCGEDITWKRVPITIDECQKREASAIKALPYANITDAAANAGLISPALKGGRVFYHAFASEIKYSLLAAVAAPLASAAPPIPIAVAAPVMPAALVDPNEDILSLDIARWEKIPDCLADDPVLSRFVCPITFAPIRFPAIDPNGITVYERAVILEHIRRSGDSPMTKLPLAAHQLLDANALQMLIDQRLTHYQMLLRNAVQQGMVDLPDAALLAAANAAHPNY